MNKDIFHYINKAPVVKLENAKCTSSGDSGRGTPVFTSPCEMKTRMELGLLRELSK